MSSSGVPDFFTAGRRATLLTLAANNYNSNLATQQQFSGHSTVPGIPPEAVAQIRRHDYIGKRSLDEFQQQQSFLQQQHNQQVLGLYLRNVKSRSTFQNVYPISSPSLMDFSMISPEVSSISGSLDSRYHLPIFEKRYLQPLNLPNRNVSGNLLPAATLLPKLGINGSSESSTGFEVVNSDKNMMNHRLQELEKQLLDDEDDGETVSAVINSEWSGTIQNLIGTTQLPISPSPTSSSSSSCCSTLASPALSCPKQAAIDAAAAICEGKLEVAAEILSRLQLVANTTGTSEQRVTAHLVSALKSRLNTSENPPPVSEMFSMEHTASTKLLYKVSLCFKLGIMAANLAILEAAEEDGYSKIHVLDFDVGQGGQYGHLLHALAAKRQLDSNKSSPTLKVIAFTEFVAGEEDKLKAVGNGLKALADKIGVSFNFCVRNLNMADLNREKLKIQSDETLAVNFAFKLYRLPDESVTTENLRDELLRRVKLLSPKVMTVVEQELNTNTAPLVARVRDTYEFYTALFESLDATVPRDNSVRVAIEKGLGRKIGNSVACEGRDRVERCEVFGKWRARVSMAGFKPRPMSQPTVEAIRFKLNSETRGSAGFIVNEEAGGICFGWMGRKLTVGSAWR